MRGWRKLVLLLLSAGFLGWSLHALLSLQPRDRRPQGGAKRVDMAAYWTAGRLFLARRNAYDAMRVAAMEGLPPRQVAKSLIMRNAPWTLPLVAPVGALPFRRAFFAWDAVALAAVLFALEALARTYRLAMPSLLGFTPLLFVPTYIFLLTAQTSWLVLLGLALFLALEDRRPAAAGAALFLATIKFNICFLFWPVFLLWAVDRRQWRCLGAMMGTLAAAMAIVLAWDPRSIGGYLPSFAATHLSTQRFPNLAGVLRVLAGGVWPAFALPAAGVVWAVVYYRRHRGQWCWSEQLPLLILVSLVLAPYSFIFDELIATVGVLAAAARLRGQSQSRQLLVLGAFLAAQALLLFLLTRHIDNHEWAYFWTPLAWLGLYLLSVRTPAHKPALAGGAAAA